MKDPRFQDWTLVAGVDPGTRMVGLCILAVKGQDLQPVDIRSWKIKGETIEERVDFVGASLEEVLGNVAVKLVAVEKGYMGKNARSALAIAMAGGVAIRAARRGGAEARLVEPQEARKAIGTAAWGQRRKEAKERVQVAVRRFLRLEREITEDEADACALAIWAANRVWQIGGNRG